MAVRRIEPDDVSGPILAVFGVWGRFSVGEIVIVAALVEGISSDKESFEKAKGTYQERKQRAEYHIPSRSHDIALEANLHWSL